MSVLGHYFRLVYISNISSRSWRLHFFIFYLFILRYTWLCSDSYRDKRSYLWLTVQVCRVVVTVNFELSYFYLVFINRGYTGAGNLQNRFNSNTVFSRVQEFVKEYMHKDQRWDCTWRHHDLLVHGCVPWWTATLSFSCKTVTILEKIWRLKIKKHSTLKLIYLSKYLL